MKVLILGSTFDSLLAAHAASLLGHDVKIVADEPGLEFEPGPNLLLQPIPLIDSHAHSLSLQYTGDPDVVMDKLLNQGGAGKAPEEIGLETTNSLHYDAKATLEQLAEMYVPYIAYSKNGIGFNEVCAVRDELKPDVTINGLPRDEICGVRDHQFTAAAIVVMQPPNLTGDQRDYIELNGDTDTAWAMEFSIFGRAGRVYGGHKHPPVASHKLAGYVLPQQTNCECFPLMSQVGRLGAWDADWHRHHSFYRPFAELDRA